MRVSEERVEAMRRECAEMKKENLEEKNRRLRMSQIHARDDKKREEQDRVREEEIKQLKRSQAGGAGSTEAAEQSAR